MSDGQSEIYQLIIFVCMSLSNVRMELAIEKYNMLCFPYLREALEITVLTKI